jgi:hypothetical protein
MILQKGEEMSFAVEGLPDDGLEGRKTPSV